MIGYQRPSRSPKRAALVEDDEIAGGQPGNEPAIAIGHRCGDVHQIDAAAKHRLRGYPESVRGETRNKRGDTERCVETLHCLQLRKQPCLFQAPATTSRLIRSGSRRFETRAAQAIRKTLAKRCTGGRVEKDFIAPAARSSAPEFDPAALADLGKGDDRAAVTHTSPG